MPRFPLIVAFALLFIATGVFVGLAVSRCDGKASSSSDAASPGPVFSSSKELPVCTGEEPAGSCRKITPSEFRRRQDSIKNSSPEKAYGDTVELCGQEYMRHREKYCVTDTVLFQGRKLLRDKGCSKEYVSSPYCERNRQRFY